MDPAATLVLLLNALEANEREEAVEACRNLLRWLERDGFVPTVEIQKHRGVVPRTATPPSSVPVPGLRWDTFTIVGRG